LKKWLVELTAGETCTYSMVIEANTALDALRAINSPGCLAGSVGIDVDSIDRIQVRAWQR